VLFVQFLVGMIFFSECTKRTIICKQPETLWPRMIIKQSKIELKLIKIKNIGMLKKKLVLIKINLNWK